MVWGSRHLAARITFGFRFARNELQSDSANVRMNGCVVICVNNYLGCATVQVVNLANLLVRICDSTAAI